MEAVFGDMTSSREKERGEGYKGKKLGTSSIILDTQNLGLADLVINFGYRDVFIKLPNNQ